MSVHSTFIQWTLILVNWFQERYRYTIHPSEKFVTICISNYFEIIISCRAFVLVPSSQALNPANDPAELHRLALLCAIRLASPQRFPIELADPALSSNGNDVPNESLARARAYGAFLYENFVFDMPLLLDLVAVYAPSNLRTWQTTSLLCWPLLISHLTDLRPTQPHLQHWFSSPRSTGSHACGHGVRVGAELLGRPRPRARDHELRLARHPRLPHSCGHLRHHDHLWLHCVYSCHGSRKGEGHHHRWL